ncbi:hypothetical protein ACO2Q9_02950 [Variovorax sp. VNK109]|uniref:hypothetical protein n=1 Tax=Variovorax sp. VNK109 TaxID=3400919 RepID=UPI003C0D2277
MHVAVIELLEDERPIRKVRREVFGELTYTRSEGFLLLSGVATPPDTALLPLMEAELLHMHEDLMVYRGVQEVSFKQYVRQAWSIRVISQLERQIQFGNLPNVQPWATYRRWWLEILAKWPTHYHDVHELRKRMELPEDVFLDFVSWLHDAGRATLSGRTIDIYDGGNASLLMETRPAERIKRAEEHEALGPKRAESVHRGIMRGDAPDQSS